MSNQKPTVLIVVLTTLATVIRCYILSYYLVIRYLINIIKCILLLVINKWQNKFIV